MSLAALRKTQPAPRTTMTSPVFFLPEYRIGPYTMKAYPATKDMFIDKRRVLEHEWTLGVVNIAQDLPVRKTIECMMRSLVTAIHYRSGLNDRSNEESFTHSLATGLVELARNNPEFWVEFMSIVEDHYAPDAGWALTAAGNPVRACFETPSRIVFNGRHCDIHWIAPNQWEDSSAYGFYWLKRGRIDLNGSLQGANLALVTLHEVLHFLHECVGLKDKTTDKAFKRAQAHLLLRFMKENPEFWAWWLHAANPMTAAMRIAA